MVDQSSWRAEAELRIAHVVVGTWALPASEPVTIGRSARCGLRSRDPAVSGTLARLIPGERGWILENGNRTRVRVASVFALDAEFAPRAQVLLQPADWHLAWDLDTPCELSIRYRRRVRHGEPLPIARDTEQSPERLWTHQPVGTVGTVGTDIAGNALELTPLQRRRLGALFAYLILGQPKPPNLIHAAAELSGDSLSQINGTWVKVMEKVNRRRVDPLQRLEDLGYHLVEVAGQIGPDDVPDHPRGS
ncbi:FHA domain-containing protein [Flexivirga lutea]